MLSTQLLQEKAYLFLKEQVVSGQLCVGELYSETQMAKEIGVSRTPFKAALIRLSHEKYIDIIPSKGFQLHVFSEKEIQELFEARIAIESHCALRLMRDMGMDAQGVGSPCRPGVKYFLKNHLREVLAWGKYWAVRYLGLKL